MLDIKLIRENPEKINELLKRRNPELSIDEVLKMIDDNKIKDAKTICLIHKYLRYINK